MLEWPVRKVLTLNDDHELVLSAILEQPANQIERFNGTESGTELLKTGWQKRG